MRVNSAGACGVKIFSAVKIASGSSWGSMVLRSIRDLYCIPAAEDHFLSLLVVAHVPTR